MNPAIMNIMVLCWHGIINVCENDRTRAFMMLIVVGSDFMVSSGVPYGYYYHLYITGLDDQRRLRGGG